MASTRATYALTPDCGADIDRVAAAMVVHFRAFGFWPGAGLESLSERVAA